ncbi:MAG: helix-hairpin-helix domain-containing protein [Planctomycetota bacterium]|nr:helix-hairpin-helix domain-containing protein [Planctomycetota bacterium]
MTNRRPPRNTPGVPAVAPPPPRSVGREYWPLTAGDQVVVASLLCICLAATVYRVLWTVGPAPHLVKIDQLPSRRIEFRIDINTTDWPLLDLLPGISEKMAQRIVAYREKHGPFRQPSELQQIPGIGPKLVERVRPHLIGWTDIRDSS